MTQSLRDRYKSGRFAPLERAGRRPRAATGSRRSTSSCRPRTASMRLRPRPPQVEGPWRLPDSHARRALAARARRPLHRALPHLISCPKKKSIKSPRGRQAEQGRAPRRGRRSGRSRGRAGRAADRRLRRPRPPEDLPRGRLPDLAGEPGRGDRGQRQQADLPALQVVGPSPLERVPLAPPRRRHPRPRRPHRGRQAVWDNYYKNHQKLGALKHLKVADIFMGGGTTSSRARASACRCSATTSTPSRGSS
jgi:hypothetical protein